MKLFADEPLANFSSNGILNILPMDTFLFNLDWMIPNVALAAVAVVFALGFIYTKSVLIKIPLLILWFLFLPNTIYLLTDIEYLPKQIMESGFPEKIIIFCEYIILLVIGILTYFGGLMPLNLIFKQLKIKKQAQQLIMILINFAIGFAVILGKVERTHSWYVFTQPLRVINDSLSVLTTPFLLLAAIGFGVLFNVIYFSFVKIIAKVK